MGRMESVWLQAEGCNLEDFRRIVERETELADYPNASALNKNVLVYNSVELGAVSDDQRREVQAELIHALRHGPGVVMFTKAFPDADVVDRASAAFREMIAAQHAGGMTAGDHFARPGANDRVWNALEKLALTDPRTFCDYYANDIIALIAEAWLGPAYQLTSQINVINPGGAAQEPHCDYHLGFQTNEVSQQYPTHVHELSAVLTLQGAIAHVDMPVESGPTMYLPYSQQHDQAYLAWRHPDFSRYFAEHHVQFPLAKGDAVFFNPKLFHAGGHNKTKDIQRMANLLQISSAFGRAMESVDREAMTNAVIPELQRKAFSEREVAHVIAACADGYPFPTNLDRDQPVGGLAPESQAAIATRCVAESWPGARLASELAAHAARRRTR